MYVNVNILAWRMPRVIYENQLFVLNVNMIYWRISLQIA
jgi:hypothetical protein